MKLLFDENISPALAGRLCDTFPASTHVKLVGLERSLDVEVWNCARDHAYCLVTKDSDFADLNLLLPDGPRMIWLRMGNCSTRQLEASLRQALPQVGNLERQPPGSVLSIF